MHVERLEICHGHGHGHGIFMSSGVRVFHIFGSVEHSSGAAGGDIIMTRIIVRSILAALSDWHVVCMWGKN